MVIAVGLKPTAGRDKRHATERVRSHAGTLHVDFAWLGSSLFKIARKSLKEYKNYLLSAFDVNFEWVLGL